MSFKEVSFDNGSLTETEDILAANQAAGGAETNSFPQQCFAQAQLAESEDGTNIFFQSFRVGILSLKICLLTLLCSFQLVCAALLLTNCSLKRRFPNQSLQEKELGLACLLIPTRAGHLHSFHPKKLCRGTLECFNQLDLVPSLSLTGFSQNRSKSQLQSASFSQLDLQISLSFPLLASISFSNQLQAESFCSRNQLQIRQVQSFQLSRASETGASTSAFSFQCNSFA